MHHLQMRTIKIAAQHGAVVGLMQRGAFTGGHMKPTVADAHVEPTIHAQRQRVQVVTEE